MFNKFIMLALLLPLTILLANCGPMYDDNEGDTTVSSAQGNVTAKAVDDSLNLEGQASDSFRYYYPSLYGYGWSYPYLSGYLSRSYYPYYFGSSTCFGYPYYRRWF